MIKRFTTLLLFLLTLYFSANAQSSIFDKGYIIQKNDTIRGYLKNAPELDLTKQLYFKSDLNQDSLINYKPTDITGFGFEASGINYASVKAEIIKGSDYRQTIRFAKLLLSGYTNLYKLQLPEEEQSVIFTKSNTHLYILKKDTIYYTLGSYEIQNGDKVNTNKRYVGMLRAAFADCVTYTDNLDRLKFDEESIIKEVIKYNTCKNPALQNNVHETETALVTKHGVEVLFATQNASNEFYDLDGRGYAAGYFWDIIHPDKSRRYSAKLGVNFMYFAYNYKEKNETEESGIEHLLRFPLSVQYNLKDALVSQTLPFINVGFTAQLTSGGRLTDLLPYPSIGFGVYHKRFRYAFLLENDGMKFSNPKILNFSVGMRLDK